jgi:hypothetical protein
MHKLALVACLLVACKHDEDYKKQKPPEPEAEATPAEKKPPPPPPKKALTPEEMGTCKIVASGAIKAEQSTMGGQKATNISYWLTPDERANMMGVDGFAVNCHGKDIKFSILPGGGKKDGMPFAPKKYTFKKGAGDATIMANFEGGKTLDQPTGTVDITAFDKKHIAGTVDLTGKLVPGGGSVKLSGSFDLKCPGFGGCEQ